MPHLEVLSCCVHFKENGFIIKNSSEIIYLYTVIWDTEDRRFALTGLKGFGSLLKPTPFLSTTTKRSFYMHFSGF